MGKPWLVSADQQDIVKQIAQRYRMSDLVARCVVNRELHLNGELDDFLELDDYQPPDPFLMPDMDVAVERIARALAKRERICIYGDYDADGVSSIAILSQALRALGGDVFYYIPDRFFEGVGLNCQRLRLLQQEEGVALVITVDTGSRAFEEMDYARQLGLDIIVTDHHTPDQRRPNALAVINPKLSCSVYPGPSLSGAGVAYKLAEGLSQRFPGKIDLGALIKIAAIGTVADMVLLHGENRWIVYRGLREIDAEERGPLRTLLRRVGVRGRVHSLDISFRVAPRINAPGRLGDPDISIQFFEDRAPRDIQRNIDVMDGMNQVRQAIEKDMTDRLENQIRSILAKELPAFVLLAGRNWHRGILGIMACKMLRRLSRPVCILSYGEEEAHGSIRALSGMDVMTPLGEVASLLRSFGGHAEAAGVCLPITNIPLFKDRMNELLQPQVEDLLPQMRQFVDAEVEWRDVNRRFFEGIYKLAPFGTGNPIPVFLCRNLILESNLQRRGPWYHFEVSDGMISRRCSFYQPLEMDETLERFDSVDLLFSVTPFKDDFQIQVVELRPSQ
ncbi:MAG: single-stranded-DNA-specific exonuclease RecJ [Acidobacteria bacterium]|nr:single-stranded-DNA-specific exonuclease RecJ [Acidobacteriota bacterium]